MDQNYKSHPVTYLPSPPPVLGACKPPPRAGPAAVQIEFQLSCKSGARRWCGGLFPVQCFILELVCLPECDFYLLNVSIEIPTIVCDLIQLNVLIEILVIL